MNSFVIEREKIESNTAEIFRRAGDRTVFAVVKGRGYGFGIQQYVPLLHSLGIRHFAVTDTSDALEIRRLALPETEILMLVSTALPDELNALIENDIILTIGSTECAVAANGIAFSKNKIAKVHIKIDTGMGRYGFLPEESENIYAAFTDFPSLLPCGLYTHLTSAFKSKRVTEEQIETLMEVKEELLSRGIDCGMVHFANSAHLFRSFTDDELGDAVRIGSAFTGRVAGKTKRTGLLRVGHLESRICELRWLPAGSKVGYSGAFTAKRAIRTAVLPIGYSDGLFAEKIKDTYRFRDLIFYVLSDIIRTLTKKRFYAVINGKRARILGHIGMTHTVCDVTRIPCNIGDAATFDVNPIYVSPDIYREFI